MPTGEFDLIDRYFSKLSYPDNSLVLGIGDDAGIIQPPAGDDLLVAVDTLVAGVHFFPKADPADIGYKSLAVNVSDIAAMGGTARWATLALTLPEVEEDWLEAFSSGFTRAAREFAVQLIGGDTTRGPLTVSVQLMGFIERGKNLRRSGAKVGDQVYVSGFPGLAGFALKCLREEIDIAEDSNAMQRLKRPLPRTELGRQLIDIASAAIDVSDGLAADLAHVLKASGVAADIALEKLPVSTELQALQDNLELYNLILAAGDDYELCFTISPEKETLLGEIMAGLDYPLSCIGEIVEGEGIRYFGEDGKEIDLGMEGWQHF